MYKHFFHLTSNPFNLTPDSNFYFSNPVHQGVYEKLFQLALQRGDYVALIGEPGTGKTTLLKRLMEELDSSFCCVYFEYTNFSFEDFLAAILNKLGVEVPGDTSVARFDALIVEMAQQKRTLLLFLDEAQNIPQDSLKHLLSHLEQLRYQGRMIEVIMAGQPEFESKLDAPAFTANSRCYVARHQLSSLNVEDTGEFIFHRLKKSGCPDPDLIAAQAIEVIGSFTQGNPRLINMVCDRILVTACERAVKRVDVELAEEVVAALKNHDPEGFLRFYQDQSPPGDAAIEAIGKTTDRPPSKTSTSGASRRAGGGQHLVHMIGLFQGIYRSVVAAIKSWAHSYRESWIAGSTAAILLVIGLFVLSPGDRRASDMVNSAQATEGQDGIVVAQRREIRQLTDMQLTLNALLDDAAREQTQLRHKMQRLQQKVAERKVSKAGDDNPAPTDLDRIDQLSVEKQRLIDKPGLLSRQQQAVQQGPAQNPEPEVEEIMPALAVGTDGKTSEPIAVVTLPGMSEARQEVESRELREVAQNPGPEVEEIMPVLAVGADGKASEPIAVVILPGMSEARQEVESRELREVVQVPPANIASIAPEINPAPISDETESEQAVDIRKLTASILRPPFDTTDTTRAREEPGSISAVSSDSGQGADKQELTQVAQIPPFITEVIAPDSIELVSIADADDSGQEATTKTDQEMSGMTDGMSEVEDLLAEATLLMKAKYLTTPTERNALRLYRRVLELTPDHAGARAGIAKITRQYTDWGNHALHVGDRLNARNYYSKGLSVEPDNIALKQKLKALEKLESRVATGRSADEARKQLADRGVSASNAELLASAEKGNFEVTRLLLETGVSPNTKRPGGWTALLYAAVHGHTDVASILLAGGAHANIKNDNGETALTAAAWNGHAEMVDILLDAGARVNDRNGEGWTPLMGAALNGHLSVVKRLLTHDARTDISDGNGWNAMTAATREGHDDIAEVLKQAKKS